MTSENSGQPSKPLDANSIAQAAVGAIQAAQRVPAFYPHDPAFWWISAENALKSQNISDDATKFNYLVAQLPANAAVFVRDLVLNPPASDRCKALKEALLDAFEPTGEQKTEMLIGLTDLGDKRPTEMLAYMDSLADDDLRKTAHYRHLFLRTLPASVRSILATSTADIKDLAKAADKHLRAARPVTKEPRPADSLLASDTSINAVRQRDDLCYIHRKYGNAAYACRDPKRCRMRDQVTPRPAAGNATTGR